MKEATEMTKGPEPIPVDVILELELDGMKFRVKATKTADVSSEAFIASIKNALSTVSMYKNELIEASRSFKASATDASPIPKAVKGKPSKTSVVATGGQFPDVELPPKGIAGVLEFSKTEVRFPEIAVRKLSFQEAIGLLLYEIGEPIGPNQVDRLINRGFRRIKINNTYACFTVKSRYKLPNYVIREPTGYRLTGPGKVWVENEIIPSLKAET
ncbi:MAG: hypothetical protein ABSG92_00525 [Conexivisphaerales archaeon]